VIHDTRTKQVYIPKSSSSASARRFAARNRTRRSAGADAPCGP